MFAVSNQIRRLPGTDDWASNSVSNQLAMNNSTDDGTNEFELSESLSRDAREIAEHNGLNEIIARAPDSDPHLDLLKLAEVSQADNELELASTETSPHLNGTSSRHGQPVASQARSSDEVQTHLSASEDESSGLLEVISQAPDSDDGTGIIPDASGTVKLEYSPAGVGIASGPSAEIPNLGFVQETIGQSAAVEPLTVTASQESAKGNERCTGQYNELVADDENKLDSELVGDHETQPEATDLSSRRTNVTGIVLLFSITFGAGLGIWVVTSRLMVPNYRITEIIASAVSPDGSTIAILRKGGVVETWNSRRGTLNARAAGSSETVQVMFAGVRELLLFAPNAVTRWRAESTELQKLDTTAKTVESGIPHRIQKSTIKPLWFLLAGNAVKVFDSAKRTLVSVTTTSTPLTQPAAISSQLNSIITVTAAGGLEMQSLTNGQPQAKFSELGVRGKVRDLDVSPDSSHLVLIFDSGELQLRDTRSMKLVATSRLPAMPGGVQFTSGGSTIVVNCRGKIVALDRELRQIHEIGVPDLDTSAEMRISDDGKTAVLYSPGGRDAFVVSLQSNDSVLRLSPRAN